MVSKKIWEAAPIAHPSGFAPGFSQNHKTLLGSGFPEFPGF
jgi:hypothetical protein